MEEELIEVLDKFGNSTGIIKNKSEIKEKGLFHKGTSIIILNKNNEILLHKRSANKKVYPNLWSCFVRGHVKAYETSIDACIRETEEEIGIKLNKKDIKLLYSLKDEDKINKKYINNIFFDNFIIVLDIKLKDIRLQKEELKDAKFIKFDKFIEMIKIKDKSLVPNYKDYNKIIEIINARGELC